jgi:hypothetical protein
MVTLYALDVPRSPTRAKIVAEWLLSIPKVKFMRMIMLKAHLYANFFVDARLRLETISQQIDHESVINFGYGRVKDGCL